MKLSVLLKLLPVVLIAFVIGSSVSSCNTKKKETAAKEEAIKQEIEEYVYPLISAFDVPTMLSEIEATYIVDITNDAENVEKYFTEQSKAVNLGIYVADLAYATTYNQKADVQSFFKAIQVLIGELDLTAAIGKEMADKIEQNLDNKEAMVEIITQLSQDAYSYLNKQGREELSLLVLAGTSIEGLYLTTHISDNTFENPKIVSTIIYQKEPLMKLEQMMSAYKDSELSMDVYNTIKSINAVYAKEESTTAMTLEQIQELKTLIDQLRAVSVQ